MTIGPAPACYGACARFYSDSGDPVTCQAFPEGIPEPIWLGAFVHTKPYKGDGGLQLEPREGFTVLGDGTVVGPDDLRWDAAGPVHPALPAPGSSSKSLTQRPIWGRASRC